MNEDAMRQCTTQATIKFIWYDDMNFSGFNAVLKPHLSDLERVIREIAKYSFYNNMAFLKSILPKITEKEGA